SISARPRTRVFSTPSALRQQNKVAPFLRLNHPLPLPLTIDSSSPVSGLPVIIMTRRDSETKCFFGCRRSRKHAVNFAQLVAINFPYGTRVEGVSRQLSRASQFQDFTAGETEMLRHALGINVRF